MTTTTVHPTDYPQDTLTPFTLQKHRLRGRVVRLSGSLDEIIGRHGYPPAASQLLAEALLLTSTLAAILKFEGIFTMQAKGNGSIQTLVVDATSDGSLRGYVGFNEERLAIEAEDVNAVMLLLGKGYLALTIDPGGDMERYQGIVELQGKTLAESVQAYFAQSEQLTTALYVTVRRDAATGSWQGGCLMLQQMPDPERDAGPDAAAGIEDWNRATMLLSTLKEEELLDPELSVEQMLFRLFHEEDLATFAPTQLAPRCRCSRARIEPVLKSMSDDDIAEMMVGGEGNRHIEVTCEFCSRSYEFSEAEVAALRKDGDKNAPGAQAAHKKGAEGVEKRAETEHSEPPSKARLH